MTQKHPIEIHKISKSFGKKKVLDDVSFTVNAGEIYGLIGLNGVGKTTLIKIIISLLRQDEGNISIFGQDTHLVKTRRHFSYLPEKFHPSIFLKGKEFLSLTLSYYGINYSPSAAAELAESLHLPPEVLNVKITKYSKGMVQKLGLLASLLLNVPLLILDEPMSGLDPNARILLKEHLKRYAASGKTVFFSSHILADIEEICTQMSVIHNQKVTFSGTPSHFRQEFTAPSLEHSFLQAIGTEQSAFSLQAGHS
ncbi:MAG: ABC transporter ATP-binding protein [Hyphomicrobiales bacterium]|nr:ABC transporter ATP-binding protein [Hyphomicrobiales bacterium]